MCNILYLAVIWQIIFFSFIRNLRFAYSLLSAAILACTHDAGLVKKQLLFYNYYFLSLLLLINNYFFKFRHQNGWLRSRCTIPSDSRALLPPIQWYSDRYMQLLSVKDIINPKTFDILQHATGGGLYDPALGSPIVYPIVYIDFKIRLEIRVVL